MSVSDYDALKEALSTRLYKLEEFATKVESYKLLLEEKTKGYVNAIVTQKQAYTDTWFYITRWFRTFIGIKDEAMLLINGELMRKYHKQVHDAYIHTRGNEEKYYKTGVLGLSGCCVDGINYELRRIAKVYKAISAKRKEVEIINMISDRVYNVEDRLDGFCKAIDKYVEIFRAELKKKAANHIKSVVIEYKYKAEHLEVKFVPGSASCADAQYTCQEARKGSRMLALHSGIEDPPSRVSNQPVSAAGAGAMDISTAATRLGGASAPAPSQRPRRMVVEDEEDAAYQREQARERAHIAEQNARAAAAEAAKAPDFGFSYSIDAEKREFGAAVELLALPNQQDGQHHDDDDVYGILEIGPSDTSLPAATPWKLQAVPETSLYDGLRDQSIIKVKLHLAGYHPSVPAAALTRRKFEGTDNTLFQNAVTRQLSHVNLAVVLLHSQSTFDAQVKERPKVVSVGEVMREVWRQLWLSGAADITECGMVLPTGLRVNNTEYSADDWFELPAAEELGKKRYLVRCEERPPAVQFLRRVEGWVSSVHDAQKVDEAQCVEAVLLNHALLLRVLCDHICSSDPARSLSLSSIDCTLSETGLEGFGESLGGLMRLCQETLVGAHPSCASVGLKVSVSGARLSPVVLYQLLRHSTSLEAAGCGISARDLLECMHCPPSDTLHDSGITASGELSITSLNLSHNMFLTYADHPWELLTLSPELRQPSAGRTEESPEEESEPMDLDECDVGVHAAGKVTAGTPVARFLTWLLCNSPRLQHLDVSHCAGTCTQAENLCTALEHALQARILKGHKRLQVLTVRGMQELNSVAALRLQKQVYGRGVQSVDLSCFSFAI